MSQAGIIDIEGSHPQIPTEFVTNSGTAIPILNILEILGTTVVNHNIPLQTTGSGNTVTIQAQYAASNATSDATKAGFASFNSSYFTVDANGFVSIGGGTTILQTLSDDVGTIVTPLANNIQLAGHVLTGTGVTKFSTVTAGTNLLNINPMTTARWIVDPLGYNGTHTTIQGAINSAVSGETVFIMPGVYAENLTMKSGVNLCSYPSDAQTNGVASSNVIIVGKMTIAAGFICCLSGLRLKTNGDFFLVSGSASLVILNNCYLDCVNNTGISSTASAIYLEYCTGNVGLNTASLFASTGAALFYFFNVNITSTGATTTASTFAGGSLYINDSYLAFPITTSGTSLAIIVNTSFIEQANVTALTINGTGGTIVDGSYFSSGTSSAISIGAGAALALSNSTVSSSNTNAITGAGTLQYTPIAFTGTSSTINTTTQTLLAYGPRIANGAGTQALPAYTFSGDTSTGMWLGSSKLRFSAGGNLAFDVDTSINNFSIFAGNTFIQKITMQSGLISNLKTPGAYPYTTLATDYVILVDTSAARTINLIAAPATGTTYRIKDNVGSAAANNITVSGNGKNIDGAASFVMSTNYQEIDLIYNGTQWGVY